MARSKLTIEDIQKALLSNTHYIKEVEPEQPKLTAKIESKPAPRVESNSNGISIDPTTVRKFKILAAYLKIEPNELINNALKHYLTLKSTQLDQAMLKLTEEE